MKPLFFVILFPLLSVASLAQPQHIGATGSFHFEGSGSGNGTIAGLGIQNVEQLRVFGQPFKIVSTAKFTLDKKVYRNQFGGAFRATSLVRYVEQKQKLFFVQAGVQVGGIAFPDTPGTSDGYAKYLWRPVIGGGIDVTRDRWAVTADYQFQFKRKLFSQKPLLSDFQNRVIDGWASGQRVGVAGAISITPKFLLLINGAGGGYTYQRSAGQYGPALAAVVHRYSAYEFGLGLGWKY